MESIAQEFKKLLLKDGWFAVLIYTRRDKPCTLCKTEEPSGHCPVCLGLSYVAQAAPLQVRTTYSRIIGYNEEEQTPVGLIGSQDLHFYILPGALVPQEGDLIVDVSWTTPKNNTRKFGDIASVNMVFEANQIQPLRGESGELAFYKIAVHDIDIDKRWLTDILTRQQKRK
jgi:hypothetical protein